VQPKHRSSKLCQGPGCTLNLTYLSSVFPKYLH